MAKDILLSTPAQKAYSKLSKKEQQRIKQALKNLAAGKTKLDVKKLKAVDKREPLYRLRVGEYRIIYKNEPRSIKITRIIHRNEGYDWL